MWPCDSPDISASNNFFFFLRSKSVLIYTQSSLININFYLDNLISLLELENIWNIYAWKNNAVTENGAKMLD